MMLRRCGTWAVAALGSQRLSLISKTITISCSCIVALMYNDELVWGVKPTRDMVAMLLATRLSSNMSNAADLAPYVGYEPYEGYCSGGGPRDEAQTLYTETLELHGNCKEPHGVYEETLELHVGCEETHGLYGETLRLHGKREGTGATMRRSSV